MSGVESEEYTDAHIRVWRVDLPNHKAYSHTNLKRNFASTDGRYAVVTVNARKLLAAVERDTSDYVLPPVLDWYPGKRNGLRNFLDPESSRVPEMPYVTVRMLRSGFLFLHQEAIVSFRNGQHRARYMTDAGATSFPVEVDQVQAALLHRFCGA